MKWLLKLCLLHTLLLLVCYPLFANNRFVVDKGVLDMRSYDYASNQSIDITGEWFFKNKFDTGFYKNGSTGFAKLPGVFTKDDNFIFKEGIGYCTYALKIILPGKGKLWSLYLPPVLSACKVYINDSLVSQVGVALPNAYMKPAIQTQVVDFMALSDTAYIAIEVSNFDFVFGGIRKPIKIGNPKAIATAREWSMVVSAFIIGSLFIMGLYHFALFMLRRKDKSFFYFGIVCMFMAVRETFSGQVLFFSLFPSANFELSIKLLYATFAISLIAFVEFFSNIHSNFSRVVRFGIVASCMIFLAFIIVTPATFYPKYLPLLGGLFLIQILYVIYLVIKKAFGSLQQNMLILTGILILLACYINDMLFERQLINTYFLFPFGFFVFSLLQSIMLSVRFTDAIKHSESLSLQLMHTQMVNEELKSRFQQEILKIQLEAQEYSVNQISRELHDNIGQLLSTTKMLLGVITNKADKKYTDIIHLADEALTKAITEIRSLSRSLNRSWLYQFDFIENLENEKSRINTAGNINVNLLSQYHKLPLDVNAQIILFRVVQEALQNCIKHADATDISIEIYKFQSYCTMLIQDNGKGFDYEAARNESIGLRNMEYRIKLLKGSIEWGSTIQNGSLVKIQIPFYLEAV